MRSKIAGPGLLGTWCDSLILGLRYYACALACNALAVRFSISRDWRRGCIHRCEDSPSPLKMDSLMQERLTGTSELKKNLLSLTILAASIHSTSLSVLEGRYYFQHVAYGDRKGSSLYRVHSLYNGHLPIADVVPRCP